MTDKQNVDRKPQSTTAGDRTDDELIAELKGLADELGKKPTKDEMAEHGEFATSTFTDHFGSWNDAMEAAGFDPRRWGPEFDFELSTHEVWLKSLIEDSVDSLLRPFESLDELTTVESEKLTEDVLKNIEVFIEKEGDDFLNSPYYAKENASDPERVGLTRLVSGVLLTTFRQHEIPIRVDEVSAVVGQHAGYELDEKTVSEFKRRVDGALGQWVPAPPAERFLLRYAEEINAHPDTIEASLSILEDLSSNGTSNVAAATALWLGSRQTGEPLRRQSLLDMADITGPSIRQTIPDDFEYENTPVRFTRKVDDNVTLPKVIVDWLDLDGKYVEWPDVDELNQPSESEGTSPLRSLPSIAARLNVTSERPDSIHSVIEPVGYNQDVWGFDVPDEHLEQLPEKVILSWQWDWEQNSGQLVLREG